MQRHPSGEATFCGPFGLALDHDQARQGAGTGPRCSERSCELGGDDRRLDAAGRQNACGANGRACGVDRHIRRTGTQNAVDRGHGLETLGQPETHPVAPVDAPTRQPGRQSIRVSLERSIAKPATVLVLHGRMIGPPRAVLPAIGLSGVHPWASNLSNLA